MGIGLSKTIDMGSRMIINSWETTIKMIPGSNGKRPYPPHQQRLSRGQFENYEKLVGLLEGQIEGQNLEHLGQPCTK